MSIENFHLKWAHAHCRGDPSFISDTMIFIPSEFSIKICDIEGRHFRSSDEPKIRVGCATATSELGTIAISERCKKSIIYILNYPEMKVISQLQRINNEEYLALQFLEFELLVSVSFTTNYEIDLWKWSTGQRLITLSEPLMNSEIPDFNLSVNPMQWSEICFQSDCRLLLADVKYSDDKNFFLKTKNVFVLRKKDGTFEVSSKSPHSAGANETEKLFHIPSFITHCWLPKNFILVETSCGLLKINPFSFHVAVLNREPESKAMIMSMAVNRTGLFVGYKTGIIDLVNISDNQWSILETIKVGQPVRHLLLSPNYQSLIITTTKGSVFSYRRNTNSLCEVLKVDSAGEIGICTIGTLSRHCMVARKNGSLAVFRMASGKLISSLHLEEEFTSMASSPMCSLVVIGSNSGFLHFIDATNAHHPKVIHCITPYETAVECIKFDNFGRFIVTSAQNHIINIFSGLPSSGFQFLGAIKILEQVKDIIVFCNEIQGETSVFIFSKTGSSSEKEAGNVLIRLLLPFDFIINPQKYHIDVFRNLSSDALYFKKWRLNYPCSNMDVQVSLGLIFHSPIVGKLQRLPLYLQSTLKEIDLLKCKDVSFLRVSPSQRLLAIIDSYGYVQAYYISGTKIVIIIRNSTTAESGRHFLEFSVFDDCMLTGSECGNIMCYKWLNKSLETKIVPEWLVFGHRNSIKEDSCLQNMEEEENADYRHCEISKHVDSSSHEELQYKLQKFIELINFTMHKLSRDGKVEEETSFRHGIYLLDENSLRNLSDHNYKNFISFAHGAADAKPLEEETAKNCLSDEVKMISSPNLGFMVENYAAIQRLSGDWLPKQQNIRAKENGKEKILEVNLFSREKKFKPEKELFILIEEIRKIIRNWKTEFNVVFDIIHEDEDSMADRISDIYFDIKLTVENLPSKSERDFWNAYAISRQFENAFQENESESPKATTSKEPLPESKSTDEKTGQDRIDGIKHSIQTLRESAANIKMNSDFKVERLFSKKRFCDFIIHNYELKIYCILLYILAERGFSEFKEELQMELNLLESFEEGFNLILENLKNLEGRNQQLCTKILKLERNVDCKFLTKLSKFNNADEVYLAYKHQPDFKLEKGCQNPFWTPSAKVTDDDISTKELSMNIICPESIDDSTWKTICKKRIRHYKLGIILRHIQFQSRQITNLRLKCATCKMKIKDRHDRCARILANILNVFAKLCAIIPVLLTEDLSTAQEAMFDHDSEGDVYFPDLNKIPKLGTPFWDELKSKTKSNIRLQHQLEETEDMLKTLLGFRNELKTKWNKYQSKFSERLKRFQNELNDKKETFSSNKVIIDEATDAKKWSNIFKLLT